MSIKCEYLRLDLNLDHWSCLAVLMKEGEDTPNSLITAVEQMQLNE